MAGEMSREAKMSIAVSNLFPGFRFSPTDVELICYYLRRKIAGEENSVAVIAEVDIYKFEPWDLPDQSILKSENEWFFFCARGRKYPHGSQSRRATELGYWKATGKERNVKSSSQVVGTKRTLVFHIGRAPRGERTEWIMYEYCLSGAPQDGLVVCRLRRNGDFQANSSQQQMQDGKCDGHYAASLDGNEHLGASDGDKTTESHSPSESDQKLSNDNNDNNAESSNAGEDPPNDNDNDDDDDCYAEILNDDIIKLEETSPRAPPPGEPFSQLRRVSKALQSNPTLQKTIYTDASYSNKSKTSAKRGTHGITQCFLCFGTNIVNRRRFLDLVRMKNVDNWRLKNLFGVFAVLLALMISVFWTVFSG